jgi:ADP-ribose pyrophosphatase YjhB (NUDIX family)
MAPDPYEETTENYLSPDDWAWATAHLPIPCADVVPVLINQIGVVSHVGLIYRESPFDGQRWCHIGGRVRLEETVRDAALRHLKATLARPDKKQFDAESVPEQPTSFFEFFPEFREGYGLDPRKQAVSACYRVECPSDVTVRPEGEGSEFKWFGVENLPADDELWPGTRQLVERTLGSSAEQLVAYETLQARYISHNQMMWQTPVLAMTAQAFLMTTALGSGTARLARVTASLLSVLVSVLSVQLMAKHSAMEHQDVLMLDDIEQRRGLVRVYAMRTFPGWLANQTSRLWWKWGIIAFGTAALGVTVVAILAPQWLA